jgi:hypothetical protein
MQIPVTDFNFSTNPSKTTVQGIIAQDLYKIYPAAVHVGSEDVKKDPWGIDYGRLTPLIVKSVQELKAENDILVSKTTALEAQLKAANDNIEALRREMRDLKSRVGFRRTGTR